ncbi:hypothetical protein ACIOV9_07400 [Pseudomonas iridis]|uniref:hypothetical protein n=1 Tax=Pseudomonas iridis TaxID=2710587 RepID=UPI003808E1C5
MERFTGAILKSVEVGNLYGALFMSLTMPDICARLSSENDKTNGKKYASWFNEFMGPKYSIFRPRTGQTDIFMSGDACYALRCAMLHQGEADLTRQYVKSVLTSIHFTTKSTHLNLVEGVLQLDVGVFCRDMCESVNDWFKKFKLLESSPEKLESLITIYYGESSIMGGAVVFGAIDNPKTN